MTEDRRYKAFISYAHRDKVHAQALHLRLESFRTPKKLVGNEGLHGKIERRLVPVFRDRDELATGSALGPELQRALSHSEFLIVLCSPASATSHWVNEEIRFFRRAFGEKRVLAAIVDGDPAAEVGEGKQGCFPPALTEPPEGSDVPCEPIAADFREEGDGRRLAFQKLAAGMLGVGLDDLLQRMAQRRQRRIAEAAAGLGALSLAMGGLAIYAFHQEAVAEEQRAIAEKERDTANASLDYIVSIFQIANPATENPKTITALTILERGLEKLDTQFDDQPEVKAKLLGAMGEVYDNLGEVGAAEEIFLQAAEAEAASLEDRLKAKVALAKLMYLGGRNDEALTLAEEVIAGTHEAAASAFDARLLEGRALEVIAAIKAYREYDKKAGIAFMLKAIDTYEASRGDPEFEVAKAQAQLGTMYSYADEYGKANEYLTRSLETLKGRFGPDHIDVARTLQNRALAELRSEQFEPAAVTMSEALQSYEHILEPGHPSLALAYLLYGRILYAAGDFPNCERYMKQAAAGFEAAYGPHHEQIAITFIYLGQFQAEQGLTEEAFASFDRAKAVYDSLFPDDHPNQGDLMVYRAIAMNAAGDAENARRSCSSGLQIMEKSIPNDDSWLEENRKICESFY